MFSVVFVQFVQVAGVPGCPRSGCCHGEASCYNGPHDVGQIIRYGVTWKLNSTYQRRAAFPSWLLLLFSP